MKYDMKKFLRRNGPYYVSLIYALALIILRGHIDRDNIFQFAIFFVFFITVPIQVIASIVYAVFAYGKDNKFTPLVPVIVISSIYIFFDYYLLGSMPLDLGLIFAGFLLITVLVCVLLRKLRDKYGFRNDDNAYQPDEDEDVELFLSFSKKENETEFCLMTEYNDGSTYKEKALFTVVFAEVVGEIFRDLKTATFIYNYKNYSLTDNLLSYIKTHNHPYEFGIFEHKKGVSKELLSAFSADRTDDDAGESGFFSCVATEDEIEYPNSSEEFNMSDHRMHRENFVAKADLTDCWHNDGRITISNMLFTTDEVIEVFKKICDDKDVKLNVRLEN